jgi:hypothetical protein
MFEMRLWRITVAMACALSMGCGPAEPERATISGQITYEGKPVPYGHIVFIPLDGWKGFYSQATILNGHYQLDAHGPVVGRNRVEIHGHRQTGKTAPNISGVRLDEPGEMVAVTEPYLPLKYNVASELTVEINEGRNSDVDFHLQ